MNKIASYDAGSAKLAVIPDASGFRAKLEADLKKIRAEYAIHVTADVAQARADIDRFREVQQRNGMRIGVDVALAKAKADMDAFRARAGRDVTVKVKTDTSDFDKFVKKLSDIGPGPGGNAFQFGGVLALIGELPAATTVIAQTAAALQQLAQAGLAVPGALAGVGASVGTLVLGLSGISDAYDAVSKASVSSGKDQAQAARASASAQNTLRNAVVDETAARKDQARAYQSAKRELEDLNLSLRGGQISEQQAINDALRQRRDLQKDLVTGQIKDNIDLQGRLLDVQAADQRVAESHQQNIEQTEKVNDANQRGITGSDQVVSANERVVRSQQQVADAQSAVTQATTEGSAAATAAQEALAQLGPNAREVVQTLIDLKPAFQDLRTSTSQPLLEGVSKSLKDLVAADLPTLKSGLAGIATAWNGTLKQLGGTLSSAGTRGLLDRILGNTADAQTRVTALIDPLVRGLGTLTATGTDALPRIVDDLGQMADRFANFIDAADKDGRLDRWINEGITGFEHLGSILLNLGKSFTDITRAVGGGEGLWGTLDKAAEKLHNFLSSVEGQNKLKEWFAAGRDEINNHIIPLLKELPGLFSGIVSVGTDIANNVVPPLKDIVGFLSDHKQLVKDIVIAYGAWKGIAGIAGLITDLEKITNLLGVGGKGKGGKGGKGILGKLALVTVAGVALDTLIDDDGGDTAPAPPGAPPPPASPGSIPTGQLPAGQPVPFGSVPVLPPNAIAPIAVGAGTGFVAGGPAGAAGGALLAAPGVPSSNLSDDQKNLQIILQALPQMNDANAKPFADALGVSVDQLRAMPRDEVIKRYNAITSGAVAPAPPSPGLPPQLDPLNPGFFLGPHAKGGPTPTGRGPGPTGGYMAEVHPNEWILPPHARTAVGDQALWALTSGRRFDNGGYIDQYGNPVTPGLIPGPSFDPTAPIAPNPTGQPGSPGGINSIVGSIASGIQGPIGNLINLGSSLVPGGSSGQQGGGLLPGLAGLIQAGGNPDLLNAWGQQTANWLGNWGGKLASGFGSALWQGALGLVGLDNSILSPNNPWFQAGSQTGQFFLGQDGPLASLAGPQSVSGAPQLGAQTITLGDGSTITVPTFGTSTPGTAGVTTTPNSGSNAATGSASGDVVITAPGIKAMRTTATEAAKHPDWTITGPAPGSSSTTPSGSPTGGNSTANKQLAMQLFSQYFPMSEFGAFDTLEMHEAGYNNTAQNPTSTAYGIGQFLDSTWGPYGPKTSDPATQLQYMLQYIKNRYGTPSNAWAQYYNHPGGVGWYDSGGWLQPGLSLTANQTGKPEAVLTHEQGRAVQAIAKQAAAPTPPPQPNFQVPDAKTIAPPRGAAPQPAPGPPAQVAPQLPAPGQPSAGQPQPAPPSAVAPAGGPPPVGVAPDNLNHNLPWVNTAIESGASAIGQALSTAIGIAGGAAGGFGGGAIGAIGPYVAGLVQQGGKIVENAVNIGSSLLVGSVPGSLGTTDRAFGETLRAPQKVPQTAAIRGGGNSYTFNGISDVNRIMQEVDLREARHQAILAAVG